MNIFDASCRWILLLFYWIILVFFSRNQNVPRVLPDRVFVPTFWIFRECKTFALSISWGFTPARQGSGPLCYARRVKISSILGERRKRFLFSFWPLFTRSLPALAFRESLPTFVFFVIHFCFARSKDRWQDWTAAESILVRSLGRTQLEATQTVLDVLLISWFESRVSILRTWNSYITDCSTNNLL